MKKKALLVISFGTSYADTRTRTIEAIENKMAEHFSDREVRRAWTSNFIIKKVARDEGLIIDTPEQALEKLAGNGVSDVIVQPTHLSDGYENQRMLEIVRSFADRFEKIAVGRPLLYTEEDRAFAAKLMPAVCLKGFGGDEALLLMGHGSQKHPVPVFEQLQDKITEEGISNVFVGTVEGTPTLADAKILLDGSGYKKVVLAPLMIVAGDHARNDLAGEEPDSWKSQLEAAGYETEVVMAGLGEYTEVQEKFARHAEEAESI